ncbi:ATP synthase delta chain, chloroplastic-like [Impatiens glandulifera]|uniref:ATP synthase delta chain, chloroplastic-like n=1 Tax=Impatiens glandulifera TaxID=253017 RepID=UPI001FB06FA3|nr:ATP synthase delta chain, chloroplastic-like [Impatiens glandulifera]
MASSIQQTPITFQSSSPPPSTTRITATFPIQKLSFSGSTFIPKLSLKFSGKNSLQSKGRNGNGASGAKMFDSAAGSYANALASVANTNGTLDETLADVEKIGKLFSEPSVLKYFINPTISIEKKRELVDEIASSLLPHTANFMNILIDTKRIEIVEDIVKEFGIVYNKLTNTELAVVTSVVKLESQHLAQIAKQVQKLTGAKNVRVNTVIDPSLVAGFTVRYGKSGSKLIDMSVKKQLEEIAEQLEIGDVQLVG